ncbi:MAG: PspC domain-containing protein [Bacteroidota bacterium]
MNKTVTINISGIIFHIEEDAFDKLSKYLSTIKGYFSKADGGNEIMSDIEARIAEMLQSKTSAIKQVVLMSDVDFVMDSMGKPEEFAGDASDNGNSSDADNSETSSSYNDGEPVKKRLYRDGDSKVLGGVCSGIGHYFGIDPVWLRIALLLMFFFAGTGFLLYIILWIAIPEAKTTTERLAMKGEKADINNISKAVKEEAEQLKKRMEKYGSEFKDMASRNAPRNAVEKTVDFIGDVLINIGKVFLKIIGVFLVVFGGLLFFGLFTGVFGVSFLNNLEMQEWIDMFFMNDTDFYLGLFSIIFFLGIPLVMVISFGLRLLFKIKYFNRWVNLGMGIMWVISFFMLLTVGVKTGSDFNKTAKVRENFNVVANDTLILSMHETPYNPDELNESDGVKEGEKDFRINRRDNSYVMGTNKGIKYLLGHAQLNIIKSQSNRVEIVIVKEARGGDKRKASERAKNISYIISQTDSLIQFDNLFKVNDADKFRFQDLTVIVKMPVGQVIYLDKSMENLMYDVENVTNTYDGDMINRRWMMTENGLKCIDCDGLISVEEHYGDHDEEYYREQHEGSNGDVKINVNGVDISSKDAQIKIDSNGTNINTKKTKVVIDKNGVKKTSRHKAPAEPESPPAPPEAK